MNRQAIIAAITSELFPQGPTIAPTTVLVRGDEVMLAEGETIQSDDTLFSFSQTNGVVELNEIAKRTAEEWIGLEGYTPTRLVTLLDLESKLAAAQKTSAKLSAARAWIDGVLASFVADPAPRYAWPVAPHTFEEVTAEAFLALA
jgi:hypothetical protein